MQNPPTTTLQRQAGAIGDGTVGLPCWSQSRHHFATLPCSPAGAGKSKQWQHSPSPQLKPVSTGGCNMSVLPGWGWQLWAVPVFSCSQPKARIGTWSRHFFLLLHSQSPQGCAVKTSSCCLSEAGECALTPTFSSCLVNASGYMKSTQGTLLDCLPLVAEGPDISELQGNVTVRKTVCDRPPLPGTADGRLKCNRVLLWKKPIYSCCSFGLRSRFQVFPTSRGCRDAPREHKQEHTILARLLCFNMAQKSSQKERIYSCRVPRFVGQQGL